ncbi:MAG: 16S rRNA (cytosine(1402)-N(4))-methyltransferase RsmH [Armatimonadetes bacterium]|nr:16S rRNA (cytosine(1402)-N(4))-methyltransferase RsmH [Armatimonadota bacterium]
MSVEHVPVMMKEVLDALPLEPGATVVDGTLGLAGHATEMAKRISPGGLIVGLDWDKDMLEKASEKLAVLQGVAVRTYHADFRELPERLAFACQELGRGAAANAILLDLGLSNVHIEDPSYGISFLREGPLDMRMDRSVGEPASAWLNRASVKEIEDVIFVYGDERWARKIAQVIVERRKTRPLTMTNDLVECVNAAIPAAKRDRRIHPATRTFQAVRIHTNKELTDLEEALKRIADVLKNGGVLCVLSYHSGEDRAVKHAFRELRESGFFEEVFKKPLTAGPDEVNSNPKARSAKLRALRRAS